MSGCVRAQALWQELLRKQGLAMEKGPALTQLCNLSKGLTPSVFQQVRLSLAVRVLRIPTLHYQSHDSPRQAFSDCWLAGAGGAAAGVQTPPAVVRAAFRCFAVFEHYHAGAVRG